MIEKERGTGRRPEGNGRGTVVLWRPGTGNIRAEGGVQELDATPTLNPGKLILPSECDPICRGNAGAADHRYGGRWALIQDIAFYAR